MGLNVNKNDDKYTFVFKGTTIHGPEQNFTDLAYLKKYLTVLENDLDFSDIKKNIEQAYNNLTKNYLGSDSYNMEKMLETLEKEITVLEEDYEYQLGNIKRLLESFTTQAQNMNKKYINDLNSATGQ